MPMAPPKRERSGSSLRELRTHLVRALSSCATEADLAQVLYAELHAVFGYYSINLQVMEREGWLHNLPVDHGVLQDINRSRVGESTFARYYEDPKTVVSYPSPDNPQFHTGRGPGVARRGRTAIWVPILHRGEQIGSVIYHAP